MVGDAKIPAAPGGCARESGEGVRRGVTEGTSNWSGFEGVAQGHPSHFGDVAGEYHQPTGHSESCFGARVATWVGLGGHYSGNLIQAGTEIGPNNELIAWYEYLNGTSGGGSNVSIPFLTGGDLMQDAVGYAGGTAVFWIVDHTRGTFFFSEIPNMSGYYNGSSAEFIDERPTVAGNLTALKNFSTVSWEDARMYNNVTPAWEFVGEAEHIRDQMFNGKTMLASPGLLSSSSTFQDNWMACH